MKKKNYQDYSSWFAPLPMLGNKEIPISGLRQFMGLPELSDTDKNSVVMHNERLENEASYFARHMGSAERSKQNERKNESKNSPCVGREYGF
jgi:hypothetical protein